MSIPREPLAQGKLQVQNDTKSSTQQASQDIKTNSQGQSSQSKSTSQPTSSSNVPVSNSSSSQARASSSASQRPLSGRQPSTTQQSKLNNNSISVSTGKPPPGPTTSVHAASARRSLQEGGDAKSNVRMVLEVQRGPTKQEIRDSINVPEIMDHGGDLS